MRKLIGLELRRLRWRGLGLGVIVANVLLAAWFATTVSAEYSAYPEALAALGSYVRVIMIVFAAVLTARMVIDEYRTRTIGVLFMYPVPRKQLFAAKLIPIAALTFATVLVSNMFVVAVFLLVDRVAHFFGPPPATQLIAAEAARMVIWALAATGLSLMPVWFGMLRKTVPATIISAFALSQLYLGLSLRPAVYDSLVNSALVALGWLALGVLLAYLAVRDVERADIH